MFQFPSLPRAPYVFRYASQRITTGGFPHSEIPGSKVGQHLTRAYRSRPRPSSAPGAKASTVCPYSLDRKEHVFAAMEFSRCARAHRPPNESNRCPQAPVSQNSTARRSKKQSSVDIDLGDPVPWTAREPSTGPGAPSGNCHWIP